MLRHADTAKTYLPGQSCLRTADALLHATRVVAGRGVPERITGSATPSLAHDLPLAEMPNSAGAGTLLGRPHAAHKPVRGLTQSWRDNQNRRLCKRISPNRRHPARLDAPIGHNPQTRRHREGFYRTIATPSIIETMNKRSARPLRHTPSNSPRGRSYSAWPQNPRQKHRLLILDV